MSTSSVVRTRNPFALIFALWVILGQGCGTAGPPNVGEAQPARGSGGFLPARCEQRRGDFYETRVASVIEKIGNRYALTVACDGTHSIYLNPSSSIDFASLLGQRVCARYRYVEQVNTDTRCPRAPCAPTIERILDIVDVRFVSARSGENCENP